MTALTQSPLVKFDCRHRYPTGFQLDMRFEVDENVTAIVGRSGSGKTTILSLIAGVLRPTSGKIEVSGTTFLDTTTGISLAPEIRNIGLLFQDDCLFPHLSVQQNLSFSRNRKGADAFSMGKIIECLELEKLLSRYPQSLSGGQRQRVALGRAIASAPKLLLLDEPLTAVEPDLQDRITDFIERTTVEFKIPVILASHNQRLVDRIAKKTLQVDEGKVLAE